MVCSSQSKKRDRSPSPTFSIMPSIFQAENSVDEYERAVTFLKEFHSRRVATLHSPSLDTLDSITEEFDELANDFSVALNVDSRRGPLNDLCDNSKLRRMGQTPKIKKSTTFKCLSELDSSSDEDILSSSSRPMCRSKMQSSNLVKKFDIDADDNLVYCFRSSPMTKRQRGRLGSVA